MLGLPHIITCRCRYISTPNNIEGETVASDTGIYWNILEILEQGLDTGKYTGKRPHLGNILERFQYLKKFILEYTGNR